MISKEKFCRIIKKIENTIEYERERWELSNKYSDLCNEDLSPEQSINCISEVIELLEECMNLEPNNIYGSDISYFCFELDFGHSWKPGCITDDDRDIDLSSAEKLYDYLVEEVK